MPSPRKKLPIGIQTFREIRARYNGYDWNDTSVYTPFDLLLLQNREFRSF
jgi:hypothetical protein